MNRDSRYVRWICFANIILKQVRLLTCNSNQVILYVTKADKSLADVVAWKQKVVEIRKLLSNVDSSQKGDSMSKQYSGEIHSAKLNVV